MKRITIAFVFIVLTFSILAMSVKSDNYGRTTVYVNIPYDTSFTLTVLGCTGSSITGPNEGGATPITGDISFNATTVPENNINAQSVGGAPTCTPEIQTGVTRPIFRYAPAGNTPLNFSLKFGTALPGWITISANGITYGSGCTSAGILSQTLDTTYKTVAYNINDANCYANITLQADVFAGATPGITSLGTLYTRSQRATQ